MLGIIKSYFYVITLTFCMYISSIVFFAPVVACTIFVRSVAERIRFLNLILEQMLFDQSLNKRYLFVDTKYGILSNELKRMNNFINSGQGDRFKLIKNIWHTTESTILYRNRFNSPDIYERRLNPVAVRVNDQRNAHFEIDELLKSFSWKDLGVIRYL